MSIKNELLSSDKIEEYDHLESSLFQDHPKGYSDHSVIHKNKTVAELFMDYLETMGVTHVFGIPGGTIAPYLKLLRASDKIKFIIGSHESGSAFMADGFARVTDQPGVVFVTSGPGATNALTGVACAHKNAPVLLVSGQASTAYFHMGSIQECSNDGINIVEVFRHATGTSELIGNANSLKGVLLKTSRILMGIPRQAAHISLPLDVSSSRVREFDLPAFKKAGSQFVDVGQIEVAYQKLANARKPVLFLGSGCRQSLRHAVRRIDLMEFVERLAIPVATSAQAKGIFPESHPCSLGVLGISGSEQANEYFRESPDVLMVIGSALGEWSTNKWDPGMLPSESFIQVDINPNNIGRNFTITDPIVGEAGAAIDALIDFSREDFVDQSLVDARRAFVDQIKVGRSPFTSPDRRESHASPILPQRLMKELQVIMSENTSLFVDSGNCMSWAVNHLIVNPPAEFYVTTTVASMGWANGAVIGAKLAQPNRDCICLTGDGSFLMNGMELLTASRYDVGAVWIILNDNCLGMVNQGESVTSNYAFSMDDGYYDLGSPDLVTYSESLGAEAYLVEDPEEIQPILKQALSRAKSVQKPQVVVVMIDGKEFPPILNRFMSLMHQTTQGD